MRCGGFSPRRLPVIVLPKGVYKRYRGTAFLAQQGAMADMASTSTFRLIFGISAALALSACDGADLPGFMQSGGGDTASAPNTTSRSVEREVEAPEIFQASDQGLWDGRPSLGGVWVAHPDVTDPQRVIIRNESNGKFVIGVIYRPERQEPGPKFLVSSDAAADLGMLAGQPAALNVTALKREEVAVAPPADAATDQPDMAADAATAPTASAAAAATVTETTLDPIAAAAAALDAAEGKPSGSASTASTAPPPRDPARSSSGSGLTKPFIQIGIFSVKTNAENTAEALRHAGMIPTVKQGKMNDKDFWRVIVGPAPTVSDRTALLNQIKSLGFNDAYFVTN